MAEPAKIRAVALLTRSELEALGPGFDRAFPVEDVPCSRRLFEAIDEADRAFWRAHDEQVCRA